MKKVIDKLAEWLVPVWSILWLTTITLASVGVFVMVFHWVSNLIVG